MSSKTKSNVALLTEGADYIRRAKKARREQVEEIKFDDEARREWLSGFSKRKKAKADEKRARAKERDHQAHLDERRKARAELRQKAAENMKSVRRAMGLDEVSDAGEDDSDADGLPEAGPSRPKEAFEEAEFSDEDQLATVTIMEDFDPSSVQAFQAGRSSTSPQPEGSAAAGSAAAKPKRTVPLLPPSSGRAQKARKALEKKKEEKKERKKSTSMETASERRKGREMEARRRTQKASLAMEREGRTRGLKGGRGKARGRGRGRK
ncbi:hypothetical protein IAU60_002418 [Kwoniella sp. DSM 27419]